MDRPRVTESHERRYLEDTKSVIEKETDFICRLVEGHGDDPYLRVINPKASDLAEDIRCLIAGDGKHCFFWSWGDTIGPADDPAGIIDPLSRVLRCEA